MVSVWVSVRSDRRKPVEFTESLEHFYRRNRHLICCCPLALWLPPAIADSVTITTATTRATATAIATARLVPGDLAVAFRNVERYLLRLRFKPIESLH